MTLSSLDAAWVAGLLEGEGCFTFENQPCKSDPQRKRLRVVCEMTDRDVIDKLHSIVGMGSVSIRNYAARRNPKHSTTYCWRTTRRDEAVYILREIRPYMGERRGAKIDVMLAYADANPLLDGNQVRWHGLESIAD